MVSIHSAVQCEQKDIILFNGCEGFKGAERMEAAQKKWEHLNLNLFGGFFFSYKPQTSLNFIDLMSHYRVCVQPPKTFLDSVYISSKRHLFQHVLA